VEDFNKMGKKLCNGIKQKNMTETKKERAIAIKSNRGIGTTKKIIGYRDAQERLRVYSKDGKSALVSEGQRINWYKLEQRRLRRVRG
jgi:hypothetical protein